MPHRLWTSFKRDNVINLRSGFVAITALVIVLYVALVRWMIPADLSTQPRLFLLDATTDQTLARAAAEEVEGGRADVVMVESPAEIEAGMAERPHSLGVAAVQGADGPEVTYYFQPFYNQLVRNLMVAWTESLFTGGDAAPIPTQVLRGGAAAVDVPFNKLLVPVLLYSDPAMIGLMFIAVLIFVEKAAGTLQATLVTPGRVWEYLISKALSIALLGVGFALLFVPLTVGVARINWPALLALTALGALFSSLLGAALAVFFDNISQFMFPAIVMVLAVSLPSVSYFAPEFSPWWLRILPTYPLAFGLREAIFPTGNPQTIISALAVTAASSAVMLALAVWAFRAQVVER